MPPEPNKESRPLPTRPRNPRKRVCGICEGRRIEHNGVMYCNHCDTPSCNAPCAICQSGMRGLPG